MTNAYMSLYDAIDLAACELRADSDSLDGLESARQELLDALSAVMDPLCRVIGGSDGD